LKRFFKKRIISPLLYYLKQGMQPKKLALALSLGLCFGVMPLLGVNTILLTLLAFIFKLNIPTIQLVNLSVYAFQIVLYVPFLKLGQMIFVKQKSDIIINNLLLQSGKGFWNNLVLLWNLNLSGLIIWALISVPFGFIIYYLSLEFFKKQKTKLKSTNI
jgi:uncharacterized protein (DUF2062 family)